MFTMDSKILRTSTVTPTAYLQHIRNLLEASLQVLAGFHQILNVVDVGKVNLQDLEELSLPVGEVVVGENAEQITEIVSTVKG